MLSVDVFRLVEERPAIVDLPDDAPAVASDEVDADAWLQHEARVGLAVLDACDLGAGVQDLRTQEHLSERPQPAGVESGPASPSPEVPRGRTRLPVLRGCLRSRGQTQSRRQDRVLRSDGHRRRSGQTESLIRQRADTDTHRSARRWVCLACRRLGGRRGGRARWRLLRRRRRRGAQHQHTGKTKGQCTSPHSHELLSCSAGSTTGARAELVSSRAGLMPLVKRLVDGPYSSAVI